MLAKMALRLSHTTCEVAGFSGDVGHRCQIQIQQVSSFKHASTMLSHTSSLWSFPHRWSRLTMLEGFGQMMGGFCQCWHFPSWLTREWPNNFHRLWAFNFCKSPFLAETIFISSWNWAVKVKRHHPVDLAQCFLLCDNLWN